VRYQYFSNQKSFSRQADGSADIAAEYSSASRFG
jgi:hypothetical protein